MDRGAALRRRSPPRTKDQPPLLISLGRKQQPTFCWVIGADVPGLAWCDKLRTLASARRARPFAYEVSLSPCDDVLDGDGYQIGATLTAPCSVAQIHTPLNMRPERLATTRWSSVTGGECKLRTVFDNDNFPSRQVGTLERLCWEKRYKTDHECNSQNNCCSMNTPMLVSGTPQTPSL